MRVKGRSTTVGFGLHSYSLSHAPLMEELSLVTGGAGFIGSHLVEDLVRRGRPVRVLDDFSTGLRGNLAHLNGVDVIEGTLTDPAAVARAVQGAGVIYHLGALASVARSVDCGVSDAADVACGATAGASTSAPATSQCLPIICFLLIDEPRRQLRRRAAPDNQPSPERFRNVGFTTGSRCGSGQAVMNTGAAATPACIGLPAIQPNQQPSLARQR